MIIKTAKQLKEILIVCKEFGASKVSVDGITIEFGFEPQTPSEAEPISPSFLSNLKPMDFEAAYLMNKETNKVQNVG